MELIGFDSGRIVFRISLTCGLFGAARSATAPNPVGGQSQSLRASDKPPVAPQKMASRLRQTT